MIRTPHKISKQRNITSESIINLMGVVYAHTKTNDGGDLYLTEYGLDYSNILEIKNWYEKKWFETHRERLSGTSAVFRVPTKVVDGKQLNLVVKNNRVGEDVPFDTHTLYEFINAEFNSPWEEFSVVMEMRDSCFGPHYIKIKTQQPLAIYVPPERLQLWQTGRSRSKISKITQRHPGINLDILRQYKMVYHWIEGLNLIEAFREIGFTDEDIKDHIKSITNIVTKDLEVKGFIMADIKPSHIIIAEDKIEHMKALNHHKSGDRWNNQKKFLYTLVESGQYSVVDYELVMRTPTHEKQVKNSRRHSYLDDQRDRFLVSPLPPFLTESDIFGVPYVHGHVESTGGLLWVVGYNPRLFDYFLPERWRRTPCLALSNNHEIFYTLTKDNIHIVWKTSRVGDKFQLDETGRHEESICDHGFNSPFEEFAIAHFLSKNGIPTVYIRAIYMTGTTKVEQVSDYRHYKSHHEIYAIDTQPILREDHDYISIRGYYNGPDSWVASHEGKFYKPFDLEHARHEHILNNDECLKLMAVTLSRLRNVGYDGTLLELNDIIIAIDPNNNIVRDNDNLPEARICNFELLYKI